MWPSTDEHQVFFIFIKMLSHFNKIVISSSQTIYICSGCTIRKKLKAKATLVSAAERFKWESLYRLHPSTDLVSAPERFKWESLYMLHPPNWPYSAFLFTSQLTSKISELKALIWILKLEKWDSNPHPMSGFTVLPSKALAVYRSIPGPNTWYIHDPNT